MFRGRLVVAVVAVVVAVVAVVVDFYCSYVFVVVFFQ